MMRSDDHTNIFARSFLFFISCISINIAVAADHHSTEQIIDALNSDSMQAKHDSLRAYAMNSEKYGVDGLDIFF